MSESEGDLAFLSQSFFLFLHRNHIPVFESTFEDFPLDLFVCFSAVAGLQVFLVEVVDGVVLRRLDLVLEIVLVVPGYHFLIDRFRELRLALLLSLQVSP